MFETCVFKYDKIKEENLLLRKRKELLLKKAIKLKKYQTA